MAKIALRAYTKEIDGLIDRGQYEHALAHCRYILKYFPKHTDTYRLMAKAYLESQRYGDASDVFQRVLSSIPDDFVSHLGMSIIREDEGNLDAAIWHMERAFEIQPANSAIQSELRRLYGRRDGIEPPKVRLTRGALARMYFKGELYPQAISELRGALSTDPQRPDLMLLLAKTYFRAGFKVEAADTCTTLLKKLPYCIEANLILAEILEHTDRREEAQQYRKRAISLNPYLAHLNPKAPTPEQVADNAIMIEKLDWTPDRGVVSQPQWAESLGVNLDTHEEVVKETPDWLVELESESQFAQIGDERDKQEVSPFVSYEEGEIPFAGPEQEKETASPEDLIPDWMKEAGWAPSRGDITPAEMGYTFETDDLGLQEEQLAPAEIPSWLQAIAPPQVISDEEDSDQIDTRLVEALDSAKIPWLDEDSVVQPEMKSAPSPELPEWLIDAGEARSAADTERKPTEDSTPSAEPEIVLGFEDSFFSSATSSREELPDWLLELSSPEETTKAPVSEFSPEEEGIPDWLGSTPEAGVVSEMTAAPEDETESFLGPSMESEPSPLIELPEAQTTPQEEMPDWLIELSKIEDETEEEIRLETPGEIEAEALSGEIVPGESAEMPQWLMTETGQTVSESTPEVFVSEEEQISQVEQEQPEPQAVIPPAEETEKLPAAIEGISAEEEEAAFAWLEGLAAKQGASEALFLSPEERIEEPPEWVQKEIVASGAALSEEPSEEIPSETYSIEEPIGAFGDVEPAKAESEGAPPEGLQVPEELPESWMVAPEAIEEEDIFGWEPEEFELEGLEEQPLELPIESPAPFPEPAEVAPEEFLPEWLRASSPEEDAVSAPELGSENILPSWLSEMEQTEAEESAPMISDWQSVSVPVTEEEMEWLPDTVLNEEPIEADLEPDQLSEWLATLPPVEGQIREQVSQEIVSESAPPVGMDEEILEEWELASEEEAASTFWHAETAEEEALSEWVPESFTPTSITSEDVAPEVDASLEKREGLPEWLEEPETGIEETPVSAQVGQPGIEEPPIIEGDTKPARISRDEVKPDVGEKIEEIETVPEIEAEKFDEEAAFAWLESLAVKQGATEALLLSPEERLEEPPEWVREAALKETGETEVEQPEVIEPTSILEEETEELPEWLTGTAEVETTPPSPEIAGEEEIEEAIQPIAEMPIELEAEIQTPVALGDTEPETLPTPTEDIDAAYAWLESLAVRQGADEALLLSPEQRLDEAPEWVKQEAEIAEQEIELEAPVHDEAYPEISQEVETPQIQGMPEVEAQESLTTEEEVVPELPTWLASMEEETAQQAEETGWTPPAEDLRKVGVELLDLNQASLVELERLPGVGFRRAQAIIAFRESHGPINNINELANIEGFDEELIESVGAHVMVSSPVESSFTPPPAGEKQIETIPIPAGVDTSDLLYQARLAVNAFDLPTALAHYQELIRGQQHLPEIIQDLQQTLQYSPQEFTLWMTLGDAQIRAGDIQAALDSYNKAEELLG